MSRGSYHEMVDLTAAVAAAAEARLQAIAAEEAALRAELAALDEKQRAAREMTGETLHALRGIGADMLWQGWLARARRDLQIRLARVLARKATALRELRRAHGRSEAARSLHDHDTARQRLRRERDRNRRNHELMILREISSQPGQVFGPGM